MHYALTPDSYMFIGRITINKLRIYTTYNEFMPVITLDTSIYISEIMIPIISEKLFKN